MTGRTLIDDFSLIVMKATHDIDAKLNASQLSQIVTGAETMILNEIHIAPCAHAWPGSRYKKEGESLERCGVCSRQVEVEFKESLNEA